MFALFPVKTSRVQKTLEMYRCLILNAFAHHHLLFDWLSYSDVVLTAETTQILPYTHTQTHTNTNTRGPVVKLVPSIMIAQVLD